MRFKLLKFLTFCLVTLVVLSPEIVVFSEVWKRHIELVQTQQLVCEVNQSSTSKVVLSLEQKTTDLEQDKTDIKLQDANFVKQNLTTEQYKIVKTLQWFFLLFPFCIGILIILYERYLVYRAVIFQQKIEMLERLWQQSTEQ